MRASLGPTALVAFLSSLCAAQAQVSAQGAEGPPVRRSEGVVPQAKAIYRADDPEGARKARIEALMGLYLVDPPRRHPSETVDVDGHRVTLHLWQPVARDSDAELETRAVAWLIAGRTQYAPGAAGLFAELTDVHELRLVFHEVLRPDTTNRNRTPKPDQVKPYLLLGIDRRGFERLGIEAITACTERGDCSALFRSAFKTSKLDARYTARARKAN